MKICPACQKTYDDTQNFCLEDGTTLVVAQPGMPPAGGGYNRSAAPTEMLQGTPTAGYQGPTTPPPPYSPPPPQWAPPPTQKRSPLPWIIVGVLGLVAAVVGIILATRGSSTPTNGGGPGSTPTASPRGTSSTASGQAYDDPSGHFSVTLPSGYPSFKSQKQTQPSFAGPVEFTLLMSERTSDAFMVGYLDFPTAVFQGSSDKKLLEGGLEGSLKNISATVEKREDVTVQGRTGLAVYGSASDGTKPYYIRFNYILDKPRVYQVGYMAYNRADLDKPEAQAFFDSFKMK